MPNISATIAVRMASKRLYGKPMALIGGRPCVEHVINRIKKIDSINSVILATTKSKENEIFVEYSKKNNLPFFVYDGDEENVLGRLISAAESVKAEHVVRVTSDCPLIYIEEAEKLINHHLKTNADLTFIEKLPLGGIVEVIKVNAMKKAYNNYGKRYHCTMVSLSMKEKPKEFKVEILTPPKELQRMDIRLTVDTKEDLYVMNEIYKNLSKQNQLIKVKDAIKFLDNNPKLLKLNKKTPYKKDTRIWF